MNKLILTLLFCQIFTLNFISAQTAPIEVYEITSGTINDCIFSFKAKGGLPSTSNAEKFKVSAYLTTDNTVKAMVHTPESAMTNGVKVQISIPVSGVYNVLVEDASGTSSIFTADLTTCNATDNVILSVPTQGYVGQGETYCFSISVKNFQNVASFAFSAHWDKNVFQFAGIQNVNPILMDFSLSSNIANINPGQLGVSYLDPMLSNINIADDVTLLEICLTASGTLGACSEISLGASPTLLDFSSATGQIQATTIKSGSICIGAVGVKDILKDKNAFSCFPNPTISNFTLKIADTEYTQNANFQVVDLMGKIVKTGSIIGTQTEISVANFAAGLYEVRLMTVNGFASQKLVVQ
jgi:hypothetical protein